MKKYNNFINEETEEKVTLDEVFDQCKPFIDEIKKCKKHKLLYRGFKPTNKCSIDGIKKLEHRRNREPLDTPWETHLFLNDEFNQNFGWEARNGVFAYFRDIFIPCGYGLTYVMFPIGKFEYLWNPEISDLYDDFSMEMDDNFMPDDDIEEEWREICDCNIILVDDIAGYNKFYNEKIEPIRKKFFEDLKNIVKDYKYTDICDAKIRNEIMIKCDSYFLVDIKYLNDINEKIWGKAENPQN